MHHNQVLVYENDGKLALALRDLARRHGAWIRELRHAQACLNAMKRGGPGLVVLKVGRDLERELALLQQVTWQFPDSRTIVVGEVDHPSLADLAWDLGAAFVLLPPTSPDLLPEIVARMLSAIKTD